MPIASTRPNSDSVLNEIPTAAITAKEPISETGIATQRDDRRAPGLQEQDDHDDDEQHRFEQRLHDRIDGRLDELGRVVDDRVVDARRGSPS